ncbi:MAG: LytR/AlgR family response regulator transcription factor [Cyclobacteriaceae bacterium]|jgi:hypothetical protein
MWRKWVFWIALLVIFLYDQRYAVEKMLTSYFLTGISVRAFGLLAIGLLNAEWLWPAWGERGRWVPYATGLAILLLGYTAAQNAWDVYLYGYVIGDFEQRNFWAGFLHTLFNAFWFVALSFAFYRALEWFDQREAIARLEKEVGDLRQQAVELPAQPQPEGEIFLKSGHARVKVKVDEITHVQGLKDYAIVFAGSEKVIVKGSLKHVEVLFADRLVRVHKSYLVAREHVRKIKSGKILIGPHTIPVGRSYRESLLG